MGQFGIGQPVPRTEDPHLLKGAGRYVDDVSRAGQTHGYVVRSPYASARIRAIGADKARAAPGVVLVLTGAEYAASGLGTVLPDAPRKRRDGGPAFVCPQPLLMTDRARYVGDCVAFVVAETLAQAKDAAELVEVDYEPLAVLTSAEEAVKADAPAVWDDCPDNQAFFHQAGDKAAVDAAFAAASHITRHKFVINRITTNAMEPRACLAEYDSHQDRYVIWCTVQAPHPTREVLADQIFKLPQHKFRVVCEKMGGGFGMKGGCYSEYALSLWAAREIGRPVKWVSERSEGILSDDHTRDNVTEAELALDDDGRFLALRVRTLANIGAYYTSDRSAIAPIANLGVLAGTYRTPAIHVEVSAVLTHTRMTGPYRGAGRPEAAYVIESMIDKAARELGMDRVELRRRNAIPAQAMPFKTGLIYTYDCGNFPKNLEDCLALGDYDGFAARRAEARQRGKLRGIGVSNTIEQAGARALETAEIRFDTSGGLTLLMSTKDHGQGHETIFKQILSHKLGVDADLIHFVDGDTDIVAMGSGTYGSRSATLGGSALHVATGKIIAKGKRIAAHMLETADADITFEDGRFMVAGTDRSVNILDVAGMAYTPLKLPPDIEPGLYETGTYEPRAPNFPNGCHVCEIEIDEQTGAAEIVRYTVVDDVGVVINPLLLKGQIHGGIAQGVGQALMENIAYDGSSGQVVSGSFMDYCMPRADDMCAFDVASNDVPTKTNPLGVKGAGEAGCVGALPCVMSAVNDALAPLGAPYVEMPATPEKIWRAIASATSP